MTKDDLENFKAHSKTELCWLVSDDIETIAAKMATAEFDPNTLDYDLGLACGMALMISRAIIAAVESVDRPSGESAEKIAADARQEFNHNEGIG